MTPPPPWRTLFLQARENSGFSQDVAAETLKAHPRTIRRWERGETEPPKLFQPHILDALAKARRAPCRTCRYRVARSHHLHYDPKKGWVLRCTLSRGPKLVGIRKRTVLRTRSLTEAKKRVELILAEWRSFGLTVIMRLQGPQRKKEEGD